MSSYAGPVRPMHTPAAAVTCRRATTPAELATNRQIRQQVFVLEQGMFADSDLDDHDDDGSAICILGYCDDVVAGTVRLYELDARAGLWQGDRLAVLSQFRTSGVGSPLVRCAVATAGSLGGRVMVAHIQLPNVRFFTRLGWAPVGESEIYAGRPHQPMRIPLPDERQGAALVEAMARGTTSSA